MGLFILFGLGILMSVLIFVCAVYAKFWNWVFDKIAVRRSRKARLRAIAKRQGDLKSRN